MGGANVGVPGAGVRVIAYECPFAGRREYALWNGDLPVMAANCYLRSIGHMADGSKRTIANDLLAWCRFVVDNGLDVWSEDVRLTGVYTDLFRDHLDRLRRSGAISDETAARYLYATFRLCRWWQQPGDQSMGAEALRPSRGILAHTDTTVTIAPTEWRLEPRAGEGGSRSKMLSLYAVEATWDYFETECRPAMPSELRRKPRSDWTESRLRAYTALRASYEYQMALYRRNLALWGVTLSSGARLGELPLLTTADVLTADELLTLRERAALGAEELAQMERDTYLVFQYRAHTRQLGVLKRGAREVFVGFMPRAVDALREWITFRPVALARAVAKGKPAHDSLFLKSNGEPLRRSTITGLFRKLAEELERRYPELQKPARPGSGRRRRAIHPHLVRHTIEAILRSNGVPLEVRQRHFGHRRPDTTLGYGGLYDEAYRESLVAFARRNAALAKGTD